MDAWDAPEAGDEEHQDDRPQRSREETEDSAVRFRFATHRRNQRRRIPLSSNRSLRVLTIDADPPPARVADGSSPGVRLARELAPIAVEVRLRRDQSPSAAQVDDLLTWLRIHRMVRGTPRPQPIPPPVPALQPVVALEPPRRGSLWPLAALSIGLSAALVAAILL